MRTEPPPHPLRPSLPPLAWFTLGVWLGVVVAEELAWRVHGGGIEPTTVWAPVIVAVLCCAASLSRRWLVCALLALGLVAGGVPANLYWSSWNHDVSAFAHGDRADTLTVSSSADAKEGRFGWRFTGTVLVRSTNSRARVEVNCGDGVEPLDLGQSGEFVGSFKPAGRDEYGRSAHRSGVIGTLAARRRLMSGWTPGMLGVIGKARAAGVRRVNEVPGDGGALVAGVTLGDRRRLRGTVADTDFRTTGLSHLVAVSGSHLVVVAGLFAWALSQMGVGRRWVSATVLAVMAGYVVATGLQASAVRALLMAGTAVAVGALGRRVDRVATLAAATAAALVTWPPVAFDAGFALSIASVLGLVVFARVAEVWAQAALPRAMRGIASPLSLTVVAQIATLPVAAPLFGTVSLVAPLANLLVGPLVTVVLLCGLLGVAVPSALPFLGDALLGVAGAAGSCSVDVAAHLAAVPYASLGVERVAPFVGATALILGAAVWITWPRANLWLARTAGAMCVLCAVVLVAGPRAPVGAEIVVMDVGQGDAVLVRDGSHAALVDTGPDASALRSALTRAHVHNLELVVLTHGHADHIGGSSALSGSTPVRGVWVPSSNDSRCFASVATDLRAQPRGVVAGESMVVGDVRIEALWPPAPVDDPTCNESSIVLLVEHGSRRVLLTGDAEGEVLDTLVNQGVLPDVDALKLGHHGSSGSATRKSLDVLSPDLVAVSVGAGNRFGHPSADALRVLDEAGCEVRRTDESGDIHISLEEDPKLLGFRGGRKSWCATLSRTSPSKTNASHERPTSGSQAGLPHHQRTADVDGPRRHSTAEARCRNRLAGVQLGLVRWRERQCGRRRSGLQHPAVRERAPPGRRA